MNPLKIRELIENMRQSQADKKLLDAVPWRCSRLTKPVKCRLCGKLIKPGEIYRDGGMKNRVHEACYAKGV